MLKFTSIVGYTSCGPTYIESFLTIFGQCINVSNYNVQYYTVILPPNPETPILVTELVHCDLAKYIKESESKSKVSFSEVVKIMLDVAEALHYFHSLKTSDRIDPPSRSGEQKCPANEIDVCKDR